MFLNRRPDFPRCRIVPLPDHQVSIEIDGAERTRWHFGTQYPRPFFYPFNGPSGVSLTRMGHPGAPNHDHHRSIWFAHHKVLGVDFWGHQAMARIRQKDWLVYDDGDDAARLAVRLGWYDGHDPEELLEQDVIAVVRPGPDGETLLELQSTFRPRAESLEFGQTNFGFLAVRVARSLSAHFGGGELTDSAGRRGEPAIFGKQARWMDYSGPVRPASAGDAGHVSEGITYFDHPSNPGYPQHWHVREDGWMGAAVCLAGPVETTRAEPLFLRFLLHAHGGALDRERAEATAREFATWPRYEVVRSTAKHRQFEIREAAQR